MNANEITEDNTQTWSDLYKDVYGVRPRYRYTWFRGLSHDQQDQEIKFLSDLIAHLNKIHDEYLDTQHET